MPPTWDAEAYRQFRPTYPAHVFETIFEFSGPSLSREVALDVGCGSGQVAASLAAHFARVIGIDTSPTQLASAALLPNVDYCQGTAESTGLPDHSVDLITAAAALHWFSAEAFYDEARRVLRPGGSLAAFSYNELPRFDNPAAVPVYLRMRDSFWPYFDQRLQRVMTEGYTALQPRPHHFRTVSLRTVHMRWAASVATLAGFARSWSPFYAFVQQHGQEAGDAVIQSFEQEMVAALGVVDREAPVTVTLPLELVLAKDPMPLP